MGVLRHRASHGDRPLGERPERVLGKIGGGDDGLPGADEDAKPEVLPLRADKLFRRAEAALRVERAALHEHGVGGIGAEAPRLGDQPVQKSEGLTRPRWLP